MCVCYWRRCRFEKHLGVKMGVRPVRWDRHPANTFQQVAGNTNTIPRLYLNMFIIK